MYYKMLCTAPCIIFSIARKSKALGECNLTLIYIGEGGGEFAPLEVFCYSSKTVGARLLKLCDFYC